jgi:hypothetical protein
MAVVLVTIPEGYVERPFSLGQASSSVEDLPPRSLARRSHYSWVIFNAKTQLEAEA